MDVRMIRGTGCREHAPDSSINIIVEPLEFSQPQTLHPAFGKEREIERRHHCTIHPRAAQRDHPPPQPASQKALLALPSSSTHRKT